jgi:hypothetical protein
LAIPTDPAKAAAYRARQAKNAANYRARVKAERTGVPIPQRAVRQQPAHYRPVTKIDIETGEKRNRVQLAVAHAERLRNSRDQVIARLPDVRSPGTNLRIKERTDRSQPERKTEAGRKRQTEAIRTRINAERLQPLGAARKEQLVNELKNGPQSDRLYGPNANMNRAQQKRFQELSEIIANGTTGAPASAQSVAILFEHAGGQNLYTAALDRILASPEGRDVEEGLDLLSTLAGYAKLAHRAYAPSRIGTLTF